MKPPQQHATAVSSVLCWAVNNILNRSQSPAPSCPVMEMHMPTWGKATPRDKWQLSRIGRCGLKSEKKASWGD